MPSRAASFLLFLGCFGVFGFFAHGYLENSDSEVTLQAARAWWLRGDPGLIGAGEEHLLEEGDPTWPAEQAVSGLISHPTNPSFGMTGQSGRHYIWFPIGHQAMFVPAVAVGEWLDEEFPAPRDAFLAERGPIFGDFFWSRFLASFISPLCAAGAFVLLLAIAVRLGSPPRTALIAVTCAALTTQFLPGSSETMSNVPGSLFFVAAVASIVRHVTQPDRARSLLWAGVATGLATLVRYPIIISILPFMAWALMSAIKRRRIMDLGWIVVGGLPFAAMLFLANHWRFGSIAETGYSRSAGFGLFEFHQGLLSILAASGKGLLWFTLPVWALFACLFRKVAWSPATGAAFASFLAPIALFSTVVYWAAGQCWGVRYLTMPTVLLMVVVFARSQPWTRWPRLFWGVSLAGAILSLGGVVTVYTAQQQLAEPAARVIYGDQANLDNNINWNFELSPLHSHWTYAWQNLNGDGVTARSVFGIETPTEVRPKYATDTRFRHWWWRALPHYWKGLELSRVLWIWGVVTLLSLVIGTAWWLRSARPAASADEAPDGTEPPLQPAEVGVAAADDGADPLT